MTCGDKKEATIIVNEMVTMYYEQQSEAEKGKWEGRQLEVTLRRFTNREIGYADRHLCEDLNRMQPETLDKLRFPIHYRVQ